MHQELLNLYIVVVEVTGTTKGKRLKSYNNCLLWILRGVSLCQVDFNLRTDIHIGTFARGCKE